MIAAQRQWTGLLLGLVLLACSSVVLAQATQPRIGYVDMKRLLDEAPQVQLAHDSLQAEFADRDRSLRQQEDRLADLQATLEHKRATLTPDQINERQQQIDTLAASVRRARARLRDQLQQRSQQELDKSWQTITRAAVRYARSHGYDLLVPSPVIYASPRVDITDEILEQLRQDSRHEGTNP